MARKRLTALPDGLWIKLAELDRYVEQLERVRGIGWTLAVAAIGVGVGLLADMSLELPLAFRVGLLSTAIAGTLGTAVVMIWRPGQRPRSDVELAALVERAHPELRESLVSSIELYDTSIPESHRGSPLMRELSAKQALQKAAPLDFCDAVSGRPAHRMAVAGLMAWALLLAPLLMPGSYRLLFARFLVPWQNLDRVATFWFDVDHGDRVVVRGSDVTLTARPRGSEDDFPETARLNWVDAQGESDSRRVDFDLTRRLYATTIPHVMQDFEYYLTGAGNRSRNYRIRVVEAPAIMQVKVQIQPPVYTGQPAKLIDGPAGDIEVLERTRLNWKWTFNKPLQAAEWHWLSPAESSLDEKPAGEATVNSGPDDKAGVALEKIQLQLSSDGRSATWNAVAERSGTFRVVVRDEHGLTNESPPERQLIVRPDLAPTLSLSGSSEPEVAQATDIIPIDVMAADDIGLGALELHFEVDETRRKVVRCPPKALSGLKVQQRFQLELSALHIKNGEVVTYRVRAADERPVPGPNETWSERRMIRIDTQAKVPGTQQLAGEQAQLQQFLKQLKQDVAAQQAQAAELGAEAQTAATQPEPQDPGKTAAAQEKVEQAADQQAQLQARLEQLQAALSQHPLFSELTQQTQQLADQEFSAAQRELAEAESADTERRPTKLAAAEKQLSQAEQKLGQLETSLDKLAELERDLLELNRLAAKAEGLSKRLQDSGQKQNAPPPANESDQERQTREQVQRAEDRQLADQQQNLAHQADNLLKRRPELEQAAREYLIQQLNEDIQQAEQRLQKSEPPAGDPTAQPESAVAQKSPAGQQAHDSTDKGPQESAPADSEKPITANEPPSTALQDAAAKPPLDTPPAQGSPADRSPTGQSPAAQLKAVQSEVQSIIEQAQAEESTTSPAAASQLPPDVGSQVVMAVQQLKNALDAAAMSRDRTSREPDTPADGQSVPSAETPPAPPGQSKGDSPDSVSQSIAPSVPQPVANSLPDSVPTPVQSAVQVSADKLKQAAEALRQASAQVQGQSQSQSQVQSTGDQAADAQSAEGSGRPNPRANAVGGANSAEEAAANAPGPDPTQHARTGTGQQAGAAENSGPPQAEQIDPNIARLKRRIAGRKWGELPGKLQTEILQAAQKKPNSEYADLIRKYFKEIAKTQPVPK